MLSGISPPSESSYETSLEDLLEGHQSNTYDHRQHGRSRRGIFPRHQGRRQILLREIGGETGEEACCLGRQAALTPIPPAMGVFFYTNKPTHKQTYTPTHLHTYTAGTVPDCPLHRALAGPTRPYKAPIGACLCPTPTRGLFVP